MKRNPEATCATCPYFDTYYENGMAGVQIERGQCRITHIPDNKNSKDFWCGEHPDFELKESLERDLAAAQERVKALREILTSARAWLFTLACLDGQRRLRQPFDLDGCVSAIDAALALDASDARKEDA